MKRDPGTRVSSKAEFANRRDGNVKVQLIIEQGLEPVPLIKAARRVVKSMHFDRMDTDLVSNPLRTR